MLALVATAPAVQAQGWGGVPTYSRNTKVYVPQTYSNDSTYQPSGFTSPVPSYPQTNAQRENYVNSFRNDGPSLSNQYDTRSNSLGTAPTVLGR